LIPSNANARIYPEFQPTVFKTVSPYASGTNSAIGPFSYPGLLPLPTSIYGDLLHPFSTEYFAVDHRGYLFAAQDGVYSFQSTSPDDIIMVWLGPNAYSGWNNNTGNWILRDPFGAGKNVATATLSQGQYYPIRVLFANGQQSAELHFNVSAPDGTSIVDSDGSINAQFLVQRSCDGSSAPAFPSWGHET
jgi:hypothetical protein